MPPPSYTFTVPAGFATSANSPGFPKARIAAITDAFGQLLETLIGKPTTVVYQDFGTGDGTLFVETTMSFPDSGQVWVGDYLVTYTGRTAGSFTGCTSRARGRVLGAGLLVTLHTPSAPPA